MDIVENENPNSSKLDVEKSLDDVLSILDIEELVPENGCAPVVSEIKELPVSEIILFDKEDHETVSNILSKESFYVTEKPVEKIKKESKVKESRALADLKSETFFLFTDNIPADPEKNKKDIINLRPSQKKIGEKFDNLFASINQGKKPSIFVMDAISVIKSMKIASDAKGEDCVVGSEQLINALTSGDHSYKQGTAQSQVGQIMVLFDVVGIAKRSGSKLTLNKNSMIYKILSEMDI